MGWLLWIIGVAIAVIVGLHLFAGIDTPYVIDQVAAMKDGVVKVLLVAVGLTALGKVIG
jgi:hypothetical protein